MPERGGKRGPLQSLRTAAAPLVKRGLLRTGGYAAIRRLYPSSRLAILRYHAVCGADGHAYADPSICVTPGAFAEQVRYLASNYRVVALPEAVRLLRRGKTLPANAVALTFDDGYADNLYAARVMARHGITGTFYITAGCVGGEQPFWPAEIRFLIARMQVDRVTLSGDDAPIVLPLASAADRVAAVRQLTRLFKANPIARRERWREELRRLAGATMPAGVMLTWGELAEMQRLGMTVGAHTMTHPNLPSAGLQHATDEIVGAKKLLEARLGVAVTMFSYPNGGAERYYTPELQEAVERAGYEAATTSRNGFAGPASHLFGLERVQVSELLEDLAFSLDVERLGGGVGQ